MPRGEISMVQLVRTGVNIGRVPPGKESFVYHAHHREEEWIYVLAGKGIAEIDDQEFEVEPGDFMAFPAPSVAHHMRNPRTLEVGLGKVMPICSRRYFPSYPARPCADAACGTEAAARLTADVLRG